MLAEQTGRVAGDIWRQPGSGEAILDALRAIGKDPTALTIGDLAPFDQFHSGGLGVTRALARLLNPSLGTRVLEVGGGLGGPARLLAVEYDCDVTMLDLTEDYVRAGELLTDLLGLGDRVRLQRGDALALPFPDASFDAVWTQNSGMNIADKAALYVGFHRVLRPGGLLAVQEPVAGPGGEPHYPLMRAERPEESFLMQGEALRTVVHDAGFRGQQWEEYSSQPAPPPTPGGTPPPVTLQSLVKGNTWTVAAQAHGTRNLQERRLAMVQAILEHP